MSRPACLLLLSLAAFGLPTPVVEAAEEKPAPVGRYVDLASTALPIVWQGRLVNYVFVKLRLTLAPGADPMVYRPKEPYFRDALVRAAYRHPFVRPDDLTKLDIDALRRTMLQVSAGVAGPRVVTNVQLVGEATPQRLSGLPRTSHLKRTLIP